MKSTLLRSGIFLLLSLASLGMSTPAQARWGKPRFEQLSRPENYGKVTAEVVDSNPRRFKVCFTVKSTHREYGISGLYVYCPQKPSGIGKPYGVDCDYDSNKRCAAWELPCRSGDRNRNGLPDDCIEPGRSGGGSQICLTFPCRIDLDDLKCGLHVIKPHSCRRFCARPNPCTPPPPPPPAAPVFPLEGEVYCVDEDGENNPVENATVELRLVGTGALVKTTTTSASGEFAFSSILNDLYYVSVAAADYESAESAAITYDSGVELPDVTLSVMPKPISFQAVEQLSGVAYFSDVQTYRSRAVSGQTVTEADLYTATYAAPDLSRSYEYVGTIPSFPDLGHFGGAGEPQIWVILSQPLQREDLWNYCSFTNLVGVEDGKGSGAGRARSPYTYRMLFSQPFDGPGTAYHYTITDLELAPKSLGQPNWELLPSVQLSGTAAPAPEAGTLPTGWMARTRYEFRQSPGVASTAWAVGNYADACGHVHPFRIHPETPVAP